VDAPYSAFRLKRVEISAHRDSRDAEFPAELGHTHESTLLDESAHSVSALGTAWLLNLARHDAIVARTPPTCQIESGLACDCEMVRR